jgi:hypothetical protein
VVGRAARVSVIIARTRAAGDAEDDGDADADESRLR